MERVYNKLVRDRIPEIIIANDETPVTRILDDMDYKKSLEEKLYEEYEEVLSRGHFHISESRRESLFAYIRTNGIHTERANFNSIFVDEDDRVFYEVMLSKDDSFLVTGNLKHFPVSPRVVTPAQMLQILEEQ